MANVDMIPQPTPNLPLLRKVLDHIDAHPEEHDQGTWGFEYKWAHGHRLAAHNIAQGRCGTAMCIAGWAMSLGDPDRFDGGVWAADDAAELLGLTGPEANDLFAASNSRAVIQTHAEQIAARAGERL